MLQSRVLTVVGDNFPIEEGSELYPVLNSLFARFADLGFTLRTSGTLGIELSALKAYKKKLDKGLITPKRVQVFSPWNGYSTLIPITSCYVYLTVDNFSPASNFVRLVTPYWDKGTRNMKKQQAKNAMMVFGAKLDRPCDLMIVWNEKDAKGNPTGSTATAIRLAETNGIPVFDLTDQDDLFDTFFKLRQHLRSLGYPIVAEEEVVV